MRDNMKIGKDDWAFKINGKTNHLEMRIPKRKEYSMEELGNVVIGLARFLSPWGLMFDESLKKKKK